jgi:hypothetical protein
MVTMAASDEHFRRPDGQEQFAGGFGGNGISMRVAADVRIPCAAGQDGDGFWCDRSQARQGADTFGDELTRKATLDGLRAGLAALLSVTGPHS